MYQARFEFIGKLPVVLVETGLKSYAELVNRRLDELLPPVNQEPSRLHEAMRYTALAPGKRMRPLLVLLSAEAVGGTVACAIDAACAIEMIHSFSLIHDDLPCIDDDDLRRGRASCHIEFGEGLALLAGDALFAQAFSVVSEAGYSTEQLPPVMKEISAAVGTRGLVGGEVLDILSEGLEPSLHRLQDIHARKTGALFVAACAVGGILGRGTGPEVQALREFGRSLGLAFQIADDLLDETSSAAAMGKRPGSDRVKSKMTFPSLLGLEGAREAGRKASEASIQSLLGIPGPTTSLAHLAKLSAFREV